MERLSKQNTDLAILISGIHDVLVVFLLPIIANEKDVNTVRVTSENSGLEIRVGFYLEYLARAASLENGAQVQESKTHSMMTFLCR